VYLAGSCHFLRATDRPLPPEFDAAYRQSTRMVFEVPLAEMETAEARMKMLKLGLYDDGSTLQQHLSPETFAKAESFCRKRNLPIVQLLPMRPWMFIVTVTVMEMRKLGIEPENGVESLLDARARQDGKAIAGLETLDEQLGFLTLIGKGLDNEMISKEIDELETLGSFMPAMIDAWKKGDERALEKLLLKGFKDYPKLYEALIVERNRNWIKAIEGHLEQPERTMVVVGAGHLVGSGSVVQLLKKRGYAVEKYRGESKAHPYANGRRIR
jgi:uncharacterized protein YbaP (TraB family)